LGKKELLREVGAFGKKRAPVRNGETDPQGLGRMLAGSMDTTKSLQYPVGCSQELNESRSKRICKCSQWAKDKAESENTQHINQ
jgi:hypothetical protein